MFLKWNQMLVRVLSSAFFIALIVTGIYTATKLEFDTDLFLTVEFKPSMATHVKMYFDEGSGFSEENSATCKARSGQEFQTLRFALPDAAMKRLRMDPFSGSPGEFAIRSMKVVGLYGQEIDRIPLDAFQLTHHMDRFYYRKGHWVGVTTPDAFDPQMIIDSTGKLSKAMEYPFRMRIQHVLAANGRQTLLPLFGTILLLGIAVLGLRDWFGKK